MIYTLTLTHPYTDLYTHTHTHTQTPSFIPALVNCTVYITNSHNRDSPTITIKHDVLVTVRMVKN